MISYDNDGNMTGDATDRTFVYDGWDHLVQVKAPGGEETVAEYSYDALGRRITKRIGAPTTDYYYSSDWRLLEERVGTTVTAQNVWGQAYIDELILRDRDADANATNGLEERLYAIQDANWNVTALVDASIASQYRSNGLPSSISGTMDSLSFTMAWDTTNYHQTLSDGRILRGELTGGQVEFYLDDPSQNPQVTDYLGRYELSNYQWAQTEQGTGAETLTLTNPPNPIVERYTYDPYGAATVYDGSWTIRPDGSQYKNPVQFAGYLFDAEADLNYVRNRYYNSTLGAWLTRDPAKHGINWFGYCGGSPVSATDAMGLEDTGTASDRSWYEKAFQHATNYSGGFVDEFTFGLHKKFRDWLDTKYGPAQYPVQTDTMMYKGGEATCVVATTATGAGALKTGSQKIGQAAVREALEAGERAAAREAAKKVGVAELADAAKKAAAKTAEGAAAAPGAAQEVRFFKSFGELKRSLGSAGEGNVWHHVVEQRPANLEQFGPEAIHNTQNVVAVSRQVNQTIANYYSSVRAFTDGQTVRNWLNSKNWREQYEFGQQMLQKAVAGQPLP